MKLTITIEPQYDHRYPLIGKVYLGGDLVTDEYGYEEMELLSDLVRGLTRYRKMMAGRDIHAT